MSNRGHIFALCLSILQLLAACNPADIDPQPEPCLLYIGNATSSSELWKVCDGQYSQVTETKGLVLDFAVPLEGNNIYLLVKNDQGGTDIWERPFIGEEQQRIISCGNALCDFLSISPNGEFVAFTQSGENMHLVIYSIDDREEVYSVKGNISKIAFSPNGEHISYFYFDEGIVNIIDLDNYSSSHVVGCDEDLIGSWSLDSSRLIIGRRSFNGGIADIEMYEFDIKSGVSEIIFTEIDRNVLISQPTHLEDSNYLALIRSSYKGNTRQIHILNVDGRLVEEVTSEPQYDHFAYSLDKSGSQIAYQRYLVTSSKSVPEVWVWDSSSGSSHFVASDAVRPIWMH